MDPADAKEPTLAKDATDAALPIERTESWEPIESTEFSDQSDHTRSSVVPEQRQLRCTHSAVRGRICACGGTGV